LKTSEDTNVDAAANSNGSRRRPSFFDLLDALKPKPRERRHRSSHDIIRSARREAERERARGPLL
jgi:hypothetical protein